jgi:hypothetical protein
MRFLVPGSKINWFLRVVSSVVIAAVGVAVALGCDHHWQTKIPDQQIVGGRYPPITAPAFSSVSADLQFAAVPFFVLAVLSFMLGGRILVALGTVALVAMTVWEYQANATSTSSTAGLVFLFSWFVGIPLALTVSALDAVVTGWFLGWKAQT